MAVLKIQDLTKSFGDLDVLKGITLTVEKGEVVSIIGPSGSGKSTLLRCATLLEKMDGGNLSYGNLELCRNGQYAGREELQKARKCFGLVFQNFNLFPHLSVLGNIMDAPVHVFHRPREEVRQEAMELLRQKLNTRNVYAMNPAFDM